MTDPDSTVCPGRCNRAWEAAERRQHDTGQTHQLTPVPGRPLWCHDCRTTIEEDLRAIPGLAAQLGSGKLLTPPAELGRISKADVHTSPSPAFDLFDEVTRWAMAAEDTLRARLGHPKPERVRYLARSTGYLLGHLSPALSHDPDGIELGADANRWRRHLEHSVGTAPLVHRVPGQCPRCEQRGMLRREDGDSWVLCGACRARWDEANYGLFARAASA